ncbi:MULTISPECIES: polyphosphate kinase 2 [Alphaproteobacteria]|uniref:ADP/GDP-polyphosphate phosphotransferase n=2 Tax=Alphaproteobacteria TaxID=28211 RepID=A0A512HDM7_9HYPH|nr:MULTISPECIES: polyphosphate kinase 2 [Alphaproteobacteria]GEO83563.1 polyphosphate kinase 2 [Ciceribacter naphthalenivorans]GLR24285.1 polyphosphate kinase 2 [Ciceribacter naphthalenivorans]GLT07141.1 polyphosphate kinase 2 [Sphingomonas psychrolutea]
MNTKPESRAIELKLDGEKRVFDIDDPQLPKWVADKSLASDGFPYDKKMDEKDYADQLKKVQIELVKLQFWLQQTGHRLMALFEGRDAAGKGGTIKNILTYMNPRYARDVALSKPTETERGQWYFQRYINHFPTAGEFVLFDRSWYNRAVVEPVNGFCTPEQYERFLAEVPRFERLIEQDGIHFFKFWLNIGQEMQIERFHDRRHDPLKVWKLSPIDIVALGKWNDYTEKRDRMLTETHTAYAPWTVVKANDKRRARLNVVRHILRSMEYDGKDDSNVGELDPKISGSGPDFLKQD